MRHFPLQSCHVWSIDEQSPLRIVDGHGAVSEVLPPKQRLVLGFIRPAELAIESASIIGGVDFPPRKQLLLIGHGGKHRIRNNFALRETVIGKHV